MQSTSVKWLFGLWGLLAPLLFWPQSAWAACDSHTVFLPVISQFQPVVPPTLPISQPPTVEAGVAQTVTLPGSVSLAGSVTDDGLPNPPGEITTVWCNERGPGDVTFTNSSGLTTTATFAQSGTYRLRLSASDGQWIVTDRVTITVLPKNEAPVVDAGVNLTITLPATASLHGVVSDDGRPNPPGSLTMTWSKASGLGGVSFGNANALDTTVTFTQAGIYGLKLEATDGELTSSDQLTVTVRAACPQEGLWRGTNDQSRTFSFAVAHTPTCQGSDVAVDFAMQCDFGSATFQKVIAFPYEIKNNAFGFRLTAPNWTMTVLAHFRSATTADGTWEMTMVNPNVGRCTGSGTWTTSAP